MPQGWDGAGAPGLSDIDEATVRRWRKERLEAGPKAQRPFGPVTVAKAYRLLHAILETAAGEDRIIARNPCHITGAAKEESPERDIVPLPVVFKLAEAVPDEIAPEIRWHLERFAEPT